MLQLALCGFVFVMYLLFVVARVKSLTRRMIYATIKTLCETTIIEWPTRRSVHALCETTIIPWPSRRSVQVLCDSTPVLALIVLLVVAHAILLFITNEDDIFIEFESFTAAFFAFER